MALKDLFVRIGADTKDFDKAMDGVAKKIATLGKDFEKVGKDLTKYVTLPIAAAVTGFAKAAMDLEATDAKFNTVFAGMTDYAKDFIKEYQKLTPATTAEARSMASGIQDMLVPMGFAREEATKLTGEFFHVAGALTNFNSGTHTSQQVMDAMNSALTGMYRPLKSLGVDVDAATVKQKALDMGLADATGEISRQAEAQAVLALIYENSTDALNAYNEESLDAKSRMGLMRAEIVNVAAEFGVFLLPIIEKVIAGIRTMIGFFDGLTDEQKKTILIVGGLLAGLGPLFIIFGKISGIVSAVVGGFSALSIPVLLAVAAIAAIIAIGYHLWNNWDETGEKAKEIWEMIKENIVIAGEKITGYITGFVDWFKEFWGKWGADITAVVLAFVETVSEFFSRVVGFISDKVSVFVAWFTQFWDKWGEDIISTVIHFAGKIQETLAAFFDFVMDAAEFFWKLFQGIWEKYGDSISIVAVALWETLKGVFSAALDIITGIFQVFSGIFTGDWEKVWEGVKKIFGGVWDAIVAVFGGVGLALIGVWNGIVTTIESSINSVINGINAVITLLNKVPGVNIGLIGHVSMAKWKAGVATGGTGTSQGGAGIDGVSRLATGTNFVPQDMLAFLHKGEGVIPAKYNPSAGGGEQTIIITLDGREIGRAVAPRIVDTVRVATAIR